MVQDASDRLQTLNQQELSELLGKLKNGYLPYPTGFNQIKGVVAFKNSPDLRSPDLSTYPAAQAIAQLFQVGRRSALSVSAKTYLYRFQSKATPMLLVREGLYHFVHPVHLLVVHSSISAYTRNVEEQDWTSRQLQHGHLYQVPAKTTFKFAQTGEALVLVLEP